MAEQEKIIGVKALRKLLNSSFEYLPLKRKDVGDGKTGIIQNESNTVSNENEIALGKYNITGEDIIFSIGIGTDGDNKNAIHIKSNGEIYIYNEDESTVASESLYRLIKKAGNVIIVDDYTTIVNTYAKKEFNGKLIYLSQNSNYNAETKKQGLYIIVNTQGENIDIVCLISDGMKLENYYTKLEVDDIISNIENTININTQSINEINEWIQNVGSIDNETINEIF